MPHPPTADEVVDNERRQDRLEDPRLRREGADDRNQETERELTLIGARTYQRRDFTEAIEIAGSLPLRDLVTATFPLGETQDAFDRLAAGGAMKVLVDVRA